MKSKTVILNKVYNRIEYLEMRKKHSRGVGVLPSEQYEVKFHIQGQSGYWHSCTELYYAFTKADHDNVIALWRAEFPEGDFINVTYL